MQPKYRYKKCLETQSLNTLNLIYLLFNHGVCVSCRREEVCVLWVLQAVHAQRPPGQAHKDSSEQKGRRDRLHVSTHHRRRHRRRRNHTHPPDHHRPRPCSQSGDSSAAGHRGARWGPGMRRGEGRELLWQQANHRDLLSFSLPSFFF